MKPNTGGSTRKVIATTLGMKPSTGGTTKKVSPVTGGKKPSSAKTPMAKFEKGSMDKKMDRTKGMKEGSKKEKAVDLKDSQDYSYQPTPKRVAAKGIKATTKKMGF